MKKVLIIILFVFFPVFITACNSKPVVAGNNSEMLQIIKATENISVDLEECGVININDELLMVGVTGELPQIHNYYAAHFSALESGEYEFKNTISLENHGWQLFGCRWQNGYVIICNNQNVVNLKIEMVETGIEKHTLFFDIESVPWVYYLDLSEIQPNYSITYIFLDSNGNEVR